MLLPRRCPVCARVGPAPCPGCRSELRPAPALARPAGVDRCAALLDYSGAGRELVARLKYRNARASIGFLAAGMTALVDPATVDVVTWVPTTPARRRQRGFDQAELLARAVARRLGGPAGGSCAARRARPRPAVPPPSAGGARPSPPPGPVGGGFRRRPPRRPRAPGSCWSTTS